MIITGIETIWIESIPNNLWVRLHTDEGLIGLGETYYMPRAVSAIIHDSYAPLLIGREAFDIENHWINLFSLVSFCGFAGAEMRAISAIDIALWDLLGQYQRQPIYNLLGGRNRDRIPIYNTCSGSGKYQDYRRWMEGHAGELAEDLLKQAITAMKIWPFDQFGVSLAGPTRPQATVVAFGGPTAAGPMAHYLDNEHLKRGLSYVEDIRRTVGDRMAIAIEGHARWDLPIATRIARVLEPYDVMWLEELIPPDNPEAYVRLKAATRVPLCATERNFTRFGFRELIEKNAADIIMPDIAWCGGITEILKICSMADAYYLPITTHDTIGPVALWAAAHVNLHVPNATIMETVRAYYDGWYNDVTTERISITGGHLTLAGKPGLGVALRPEVLQRPDAHIELTTADDLPGEG